jgi:pantoate--beta-alanine ligase
MATRVPHVETVAALREIVRGWRQRGETVALVPTMGALHGGHLELVELGHARADRVVVSVFVNPAQFAPHEDFDRYPRTLDSDLDKLATVACDLAWAPTVAEMYPAGAAAHATRVQPAGAALGLEADFRPHFFAGVATVCCKLFNQVQPDLAIFGEKDYQQLAVMRQMVRDLDMPLEILGAPTVREADGLAMSSRNRYLSADERRIAPALNAALQALAARLAAAGPGLTGTTADALAAETVREIAAAGFGKVDYVAVRDADTLAALGESRPAALRILAAAWLGKTRLIDNIAA